MLGHLDIDCQEQYERRDCVIIQNFPEYGPHEDLVRVVIDLCAVSGGRISPWEISVVHRLGRYVAGRARPIIVKFTRRCIKTSLMKNKHKLRRVEGWCNIYLDENLRVQVRHC